jgi:chromosome segregation protein
MPPKLKSLELHGYKTFANRILFEFPAEITSIVGPNGSGKSNVADAIRWVLGEQSFSVLRGKKTEDMIFSGSDQRSRSGMADATITLDNRDGWLPIDFGEVSISRRAYRDGQNEYLLNGQRVRLKEISELLAQSGLAQRTYTIIGQGLVDAALSLKPDERRQFFEEAAGIGLYRKRREEALERLDSTQRNMDRVLDILGELGPRLKSLERQARKAQEYDRIKADLEVLLREWYGFHWHRLQRELSRAREAVQAQETRLSSSREKAKESDARVDKVRKKLQELRQLLSQWHAESALHHNEREKISRNLAVIEERQRALLDLKTGLGGDLVQLEEVQKGRTNSIEDQKEEILNLKRVCDEGKVQLASIQKSLDDNLKERERLDVEIRGLQKKLSQEQSAKANIFAHQNELKHRLDNLTRSRESINMVIQNESSDLENSRNHLEKTLKSREQTEKAHQQADEKLKRQRNSLALIEDEIKRLDSEKAVVHRENAQISARLEVFEQAEKAFVGLNQGARFLLEAARDGKVKGKLQPLGGMLEVPQEYEIAIASAVSDFIDGVLLEKTDLEEVLNFLNESGNSRTLLFPVDNILDLTPVQTEVNGDCFGVASSLISISKELAPVMNVVLGQIVVVRDRKTAQKMIKSLPMTFKVVTLKGEIFWGNGIIISGKGGKEEMVSRPRQKRELMSSLLRIQENREKIDQKMLALVDQHKGQKSLESELVLKLDESNQAFRKAVQEHQQANLHFQQLHQKNEYHKNQAADLEKQIQTSTDELQKTSNNLNLIDSHVREFDDETRKKRAASREIPIEDLQAEATQWKTTFAVSLQTLKDAERRLLEHRAVLERDGQQIQLLQKRFTETDSSLNQIQIEKGSNREKESELNQVIDNLQEKITPAEAELNRLEVDFGKLQDDQMVAQQTYTVAERHAAQAQLELTRQRDGLESLRHKIEDDFGLVAFEYQPDISGPTPLPLEGMVNELPVILQLSPEVEDNINRQKTQLRRLGPINIEAQQEFTTVQDRFEFLTNQVTDLKNADENLRQIIAELDDLMKKEFQRTFQAVADEFKRMFTRLFGGGAARLYLIDEENPADSGVEIEAQLPGRRKVGLALLSGGERSLTAVALIFSLLKVSPTPFCVLDEVDAALDEANVGRFGDLLDELSRDTQFIVITHNRNTVQISDVIYGVTMGRDATSQIISLKLDEVSDELVK